MGWFCASWAGRELPVHSSYLVQVSVLLMTAAPSVDLTCTSKCLCPSPAAGSGWWWQFCFWGSRTWPLFLHSACPHTQHCLWLYHHIACLFACTRSSRRNLVEGHRGTRSLLSLQFLQLCWSLSEGNLCLLVRMKWAVIRVSLWSMGHPPKEINIIRSNKAAMAKGSPGKAQGCKHQEIVLALVGIHPKGSTRPCFFPKFTECCWLCGQIFQSFVPFARGTIYLWQFEI